MKQGLRQLGRGNPGMGDSKREGTDRTKENGEGGRQNEV